MSRLHAVVLVLGDVGRSPRMQNHVWCLAEQGGYDVDFIGMHGTEPRQAITQHPHIKLWRIHPSFADTIRSKIPRSLYIFYAALKLLQQILQLLFILLFKLSKPEFVLVQNPPCIPTFVVAQLVCWLRNAKLIIDWHNYGYSIMALSMGPTHKIVRCAKWYESTFSKGAYAHFCVSQAMQADLLRHWGIRATVLYDRPPEHFKPTILSEQHKLFMRLGQSMDMLSFYWGAVTTGESVLSRVTINSSFREQSGQDELWGVLDCSSLSKADQVGIDSEHTYFTYLELNSPDESAKAHTASTDFTRLPFYLCLVEERPVLIISSTSWTEDEDFGVLLAAIEKCEDLARIYEAVNRTEKANKIMITDAEADPSCTDLSCELGGDSDVDLVDEDEEDTDGLFPPMLFIITGKGPQKEFYEKQISMRQEKWEHAKVLTMWLSAEDYPKMLGSADLGVCLHTSSSGLDLPMKVVDMFGCGLPVCAVDYPCLKELVQDGINGYTFKTSDQLGKQLFELSCGFPAERSQLQALRKHVDRFRQTRWGDEWQRAAKPVFTSINDTKGTASNYAHSHTGTKRKVK
eukprot:GILK01003816.1.p1 GENE.GILK01003816.1~~GILK01003816.1.p1  ORF type:complete len:573 (+),score=93.14 GILK01003816.1:165-1883(+)